jgi:hypothetical protein
MEETRSVISGSAALEIVLPGTCDPNDLDLYCPEDSSDTVIDFLKSYGYVDIHHTGPLPAKTPAASSDGREGTLDTTDTEVDWYQEDYALRTTIKAVFALHHCVDGRKINVIQSASASSVAPIFTFHSTCVMNAVTHSGAISFYPSLTFKKLGACDISIPSTAFIIYLRGGIGNI